MCVCVFPTPLINQVINPWTVHLLHQQAAAGAVFEPITCSRSQPAAVFVALLAPWFPPSPNFQVKKNEKKKTREVERRAGIPLFSTRVFYVSVKESSAQSTRRGAFVSPRLAYNPTCLPALPLLSFATVATPSNYDH